MSCPVVAFEDLELIDYKKAWDYQTSLFKPIIDQKIYNRKNPDSTSFLSSSPPLGLNLAHLGLNLS